jgi:hypothetical protein
VKKPMKPSVSSEASFLMHTMSRSRERFVS